MKKIIDFSKKVAELAKEYPEFTGIMADLGFREIISPAALALMGKVMTVPKGAAVKGIPLEKIVERFEAEGFRVVGLPEDFVRAAGDADHSAAAGSSDHAGQVESDAGDYAMDSADARMAAAERATVTDADRVDKLAALIRRVEGGEDVEAVRADFVAQFGSVSVHEIAGAEQKLIEDGMDPRKVQKLCDLHSALFHGKTEAEIWAEEEKRNANSGVQIPEGHPIDYFHRENAALEKILKKTELDVNFGTDFGRILEDLNLMKKVRPLYGKKEELIMPVLDRYGITGPSEVMWGVDDEIKAETSRLASSMKRGIDNDRAASMFESLKDDILAVVKRMEEMIYKEEKILLPLGQDHFSDDEWVDIYADLPEMGAVYIDAIPTWQHGEEVLAARRSAWEKSAPESGVVKFAQGQLTVAQLRAIFELLPIDITFIDENDINTFFSNQGKVFSRPSSALGRKVYDCHPARIRPVVEQLISEFREGSRDSYERWIPNPLKPVKIQYIAVRDPEGKFLGTLELVQDFSEDRKHFRRS